MAIEVKGCSGYSMGLNEEKGRLYLGSGRMHILSFPALEKVARLDRVSHSRPILSKDGRYIAFFNAVGFLTVYTTTEPMRQVLHRNWKTSTSAEHAAFYRDGEALLVAVHNRLYAFWGEDLAHETLLCGDGEANWNPGTVNVFISSISICQDEILVTFYSREDAQENYVVRFRHLGDKEPIVVTWPSFLHRYKQALFDRRGGVTLFNNSGIGPMLLLYDAFPKDFADVKKTVDLQVSGSGRCKFSDDGKYLSITTFDYMKQSFPYAASLWDTSNWTQIHCVNDRGSVTDAAFSLENHYWLVGSSKPLLIPIS